jgi:hypothetical protein
MTTIIPVQQNTPLVDIKTGYFTAFFKRYLDQILARIGGINGGTYTALRNVSATITWDLNAAPVAVVTLVSGANTLSPPLNIVAGLIYRLTIIQPSSGAAGTISWPKPPFLFAGASAPSLSTANSALDEVWFSSDGTNIKTMVFAKNLS